MYKPSRVYTAIGAVAQRTDNIIDRFAAHQHTASAKFGIVTLELTWRDALVLDALIEKALLS